MKNPFEFSEIELRGFQAAIIKKRIAGWTDEEITEFMGITPYEVFTLQCRHVAGMTTNKPPQRRLAKNIIRLQKEMIAILLSCQFKQIDIAKVFGVSRARVSAIKRILDSEKGE